MLHCFLFSFIVHGTLLSPCQFYIQIIIFMFLQNGYYKNMKFLPLSFYHHSSSFSVLFLSSYSYYPLRLFLSFIIRTLFPFFFYLYIMTNATSSLSLSVAILPVFPFLFHLYIMTNTTSSLFLSPFFHFFHPFSNFI